MRGFVCYLFIWPLAACVAAHMTARVVWAAEARSAVVVLSAEERTGEETTRAMEKFILSLEEEHPGTKALALFGAGQVSPVADEDAALPQSLSGVLASLVDEGVTRIALLALHLAPGEAYAALARRVEALGILYAGRAEVRLSPPLVAGEQDVFSLASYLIHSMPGEVKPGDAVIFAGRATETDPVGLLYPALNWAMFVQGEKGSFYLALNQDNAESVNHAVRILKLNRRLQVWIVPLGALGDKRAAEEDGRSLAARLREAGLTVKTHEQGLLSIAPVAGMYKLKLRRIMRELSLRTGL